MDKETESKIKAMLEDGFSSKKLSFMFRIPQEVIVGMGVQIKQESFSEERIIALYQLGVNVGPLAQKFGCSYGPIKRILKKHDITFRDSSECRSYHQLNVHRFDDLNDLDVIQYMGLFWADGHNNTKRGSFDLVLQARDKQRILQLANFMEYQTVPHLITKRVPDKQGVMREYVGLRVCNKYFTQRLHDLGCVNKKSLIAKYPKWLFDLKNPVDSQRRFILGLFEGDGSLFKPKTGPNNYDFGIIGTLDVCSNIQKFIREQLGIELHIEYISTTNNDTYNVKCGGNQQVKRVMGFLYQDHNPQNRLERKHTRYLDLCVVANQFEQVRTDRHHLHQTVLNDFDGGSNTKQIAHNLNLPYERVRGILRRNNRLMITKPSTISLSEKLYSEHLQGKTVRELSGLHDITETYCRLLLSWARKSASYPKE